MTHENLKRRIVEVLTETAFDNNIKRHVPVAFSERILRKRLNDPVRHRFILAMGELRRAGIVVTRTHRSGLSLYKLADKTHRAWLEGGEKTISLGRPPYANGAR